MKSSSEKFDYMSCKPLLEMSLQLEHSLKEFNTMLRHRVDIEEKVPFRLDSTKSDLNTSSNLNIKPVVQVKNNQEDLERNINEDTKVTRKQVIQLKKKAEQMGIKVKMPLTPYFLFMREKRDIVQREFPSITGTGITKMLGEVWKYFNAEQKKPYIQSYDRSQQKFKAYLEKRLKSR